MDELHALRQELADMRREIGRLKRTRWITPASLASVLVAFVALGVAAPKRQDSPQADHRATQLAQDISCKSVRIVDDTGKVLIQLGSDKDGGFFTLNGADGKKRFFTAVENNGGFSDWFDAGGKRRASICAVGVKGNAEFHLADKLEHLSAIFMQADTGGYLDLRGPDENTRVAAGVDNGGGYMDVFDSLSNRRESFYLDEKNIAQFKIIGADKVPRFVASGNKEGGQAIAYGEDGKSIGRFPVK